MHKFFRLFFIIITLTIVTSSCSLDSNGYSISAFVKRLNSYDESYDICEEGFLIDEKSRTMTKFFGFAENEILLQLQSNEENQLCSINIVLDNITKNNTSEINFINNCIKAFVNNEEISNQLINELKEDALFKPDINTKEEKIGNVQLLVDVTEIGTVITVLQSIP